MSAGVDEVALRALVRQALLEALPALASASPSSGLAGRGGPVTGQASPLPAAGVPEAGAPAVRSVQLTDDHELAAFVREVVRLADDPVHGAALRAGRLSFSLADRSSVGPPSSSPQPSASPAAAASSRVVVSGPVLERHVRSAAEKGSTLVAASRGLVTPLARELARSRGVTILVEPITRRRDR